MSTTDRIEKTVLLRASRAKVWGAISDSKQYGAWFGAEFEQAFTPGTHIVGKIRPTRCDPDIARSQEPYSGAKFEIWIDRVEPEKLFSFYWHPFAIDPNHDYSAETKTLVTFQLEDAPDGILLRITETGFDKLPPGRKLTAFEMNAGGWQMQCKLVEKYLGDAK